MNIWNELWWAVLNSTNTGKSWSVLFQEPSSLLSASEVYGHKLHSTENIVVVSFYDNFGLVLVKGSENGDYSL